MKTITLLILLVFSVVKIYAQNYQINFTGTGASTSVDSVKVQNLSQCTDTILAGSDILNLTPTLTGINENAIADHMLHIYPEPVPGSCTVDFNATAQGYTTLELDNITGKRIVQVHELLSQGRHTYYLSGISTGVYLLKIRSDKYSYSSKIISISAGTGIAEIKHLQTDPVTNEQNTSDAKKICSPGGKSPLSIISMQCNPGDTLKLTGKSGNYRTICMLVATHTQTVTFTFVKCTDADSNNYAVVQLGTQLWMQENLKTSKYRDGSNILNVTDSATWGSTNAGAYCDFHNDPSEGAYYGHLYNYYAVADSRNICPVGWHVASNPEWNIMEKFIDNTVDTTALGGTGNFIGKILKEGCNTRWQYFDSTAGWNSAGFTALCTNFRNSSGAWSLAPNNNHDDSFWTATPYNANMAWSKSFRWCACDIFSIFNFKRAGSSVRCIKDQ
jgi:uncharacterized protein (TIGR02145 family)